jgi:hypothetical protein
MTSTGWRLSRTVKITIATDVWRPPGAMVGAPRSGVAMDRAMI